MGTKIIPSSLIARTALDEHGSLLDIERLPEESLLNYSERLFDVYANRASSTYEGLLNGINRELNLKRDDVLTISLRGIGFGYLDHPNITITQTTITNNIVVSNVFDGTNVTISGNKIIDSTLSLNENELRGFSATINNIVYMVKDNTETEIILNKEIQTISINDTYLVKLDLEPGELVGLGLEIGNMVYRIKENTSNIIQIEDGDLLDNQNITRYKIRAFNPRVDITGATILLYKEYQNKYNFQLEKKIKLREDVVFHKDIIDIINTLKFFEAENLKGSREDIFAFTLNRQSSENIVIKEIVPASKFFKLENSNIKEGSVRFTEADIFLRETLEEDVIKREGNYFIDYSNGIVKVNKTPSGIKTVSYSWNNFPFTVRQSKTVINPFNKEDSKEFLFLQKEMKRYKNITEQFKSSVPKMDMIEYMAELLSIKPSNWGE